MGMDRTVAFPAGAAPSWPAVRELLADRGYPLQMRMIDGELAFPDEEPPESWRELRVGNADGMVTIRREGERAKVVTWGNAQGPLLQLWNAVAWALAEAGSGSVEAADGSQSADEFHRTADLPGPLRG